MRRMMPAKSKFRNAFYKVIAIFFGLALGIGATGYVYFESNRQEIIEHTQRELSSIAELKANEISRWRMERMGDAAVIAKNPLLGFGFRQQLILQPQRMQKTLGWMQTIREHYDYSDVLLLDVEGNVRLSVSGENRVDPALAQSLSEVLHSKEILFFDLHFSETAGGIRTNLIVPILEQEEEGSPVVGILILEIDPYRFLYPFIQSWPTPSPTSETLLTRREGSDVLFLNELRHRKGTALSMRFPVTDPDLPTAMAIRGKKGIMEGIDYREVPVLAVVHSIEDSPWYIVAKVDKSEVYAPVTYHARWVAFVVILLIAAAGVSIMLLWTRHYARLAQKEQEILKRARDELEQRVLERTADLKESEEKYRTLVENVPLVVYRMKPGGEILFVNHFVEEIFGFTPLEISRNPELWSGRVYDEDREKVEEFRKKSFLDGIEFIAEYRVRHRDGHTVYVMDHAIPFSDSEGGLTSID